MCKEEILVMARFAADVESGRLVTSFFRRMIADLSSP